MYKTLITATDLKALLEGASRDRVVVFDCRHRLGDPGYGDRAFVESHIPGARRAHLDNDLSAPIVPGKTGRHPLPSAVQFVDFLRSAGVSQSTQVVAYDDMSGAIAARCWWMCRWVGLDTVAVLDGGFPAWTIADYPIELAAPNSTRPPGDFEANIRRDRVICAAEITAKLADPNDNFVLLDARASDRYSGAHEPIDAVPGHIPGAVSVPFAGNVAKGERLKTADELRARFAGVGVTDDTEVVNYCGSGVTAAYNTLAMVHAGLPEPKLYAGSWSHWITDPERPVAP